MTLIEPGLSVRDGFTEGPLADAALSRAARAAQLLDEFQEEAPTMTVGQLRDDVHRALRRFTQEQPPTCQVDSYTALIRRGARIVDERHWDGLPTGAGRRVTTSDAPPSPRRSQSLGPETGPLQALLNRAAAASIEVGRRPLSVYDELTGTRPFTTSAPKKEAR